MPRLLICSLSFLAACQCGDSGECFPLADTAAMDDTAAMGDTSNGDETADSGDDAPTFVGVAWDLQEAPAWDPWAVEWLTEDNHRACFMFNADHTITLWRQENRRSAEAYTGGSWYAPEGSAYTVEWLDRYPTDDDDVSRPMQWDVLPSSVADGYTILTEDPETATSDSFQIYTPCSFDLT